jgi:hypothetical protein
MILAGKFARWAALALLLRVGIDLFVVDLSAAFAVAKSRGTSGPTEISSVQEPSTPADPADLDDYGDDCFCCSSHVLTSQTVELSPLEVRLIATPLAETSGPVTKPSGIFHPPKA